MPKCKYCGKSGFFLTVSKNSLCNNCDSFVVMDIQNRARIHNDSVRLIRNSENPDVVYSRIRLAIENLTVLFQYEKKGIATINPVPSKCLEVFKVESNQFLLDTFIKANKALTVKILNLKSTSAKRNQIQKFIDKTDEYIPKVNDWQSLKELRQDCERQLQNLPLGNNPKNRLLNDPLQPSSSTTAIKIKEIHPAKLLFIEKTSNGNAGIGGAIKITIKMSDESKVEVIGPDEPSIIFKDLPVSKPKQPSLVEKPPYYPTYAGLSSEQRWLYLNWLNDITEEIDIGYVFLYYYGLERNLLVGDFETAFQEILLLRKHHTNNSFESYSYNALLYSSAFQHQLNLVQFVMEKESKNGIDNVDLMFKYRLEKEITAEEFMSLAKKIKGVNTRYIKALPDRYKAAISIVLSEKFGIAEYPITSIYRIEDIPRQQTIAFANVSFPSSMRLPSLPNFLKYLPFISECSEIFIKAHELVKEDLIRERLIND